MLKLTLELLLAPLLVGASTVAARRFGEQRGGLLSAFPAIVGPLLLIDAQQHGVRFAAESASATLAGLLVLSGFAVAYGRSAGLVGWRVSLAAGWVTAATFGVLLAALHLGLAPALLVAAASLAVAHRSLPRPARAAVTLEVSSRDDLLWRMGLTVVLILALVGAAGVLGPTVGGVLASLPALASILAVFTHVQGGRAQVRDLLHGMLRGMVGFGVFCLLVGALVQGWGVAPAFALATVAAVGTQLALAGGLGRGRWQPVD